MEVRGMKRQKSRFYVLIMTIFAAVMVLSLAGCSTLSIGNQLRNRRGSDESASTADDGGVSTGKPGTDGSGNTVQPGGSQTPQSPPAGTMVPDGSVMDIVTQTLGMNYIGGSVYPEHFQSINENGNYRIEKQLITDTGWIAALRMDYDADGQDEILAAAFVGGQTSNDIVLHMLEQSGNTWTDAATISTQAWDGNGEFADTGGASGQVTPFRRDVFVQGAAGANPIFIYVEDAGLEYHFADGLEWNLRRCTYDGSAFRNSVIGQHEDGSLGFGGSSGIEGFMKLDPNLEAPEDRPYIETFVQNFRNTGLYNTQSLEYSYPLISANGGGCYGLCRFDRYETSESTDANDMVSLGASVVLRDLSDGSGYGTVMHQFNNAGNASAGSAADMGYSIPDSSTRYLTRQELEVLTSDQLRYVRNEIYARHGRIFTSDDLRAYFESQPWYHGTIQPNAFTDDMLNEIERANVRLITEIEGARS